MSQEIRIPYFLSQQKLVGETKLVGRKILSFVKLLGEKWWVVGDGWWVVNSTKQNFLSIHLHLVPNALIPIFDNSCPP
jgi:hypothetical protein